MVKQIILPKRFYLTVILIFSSLCIEAQTYNKIDSLKEVSCRIPEDSIKITIYYKIAIGLMSSNTDEMYLYADKALKLAERLDIKTEIAKSYHILGICYAERGDLKRALEYFFKSLNTLEKLGDEKRKGVAIGAIARVYQLLENHEKALEYDLKALEINIKSKDTSNLAINYNNVGADYSNLENYDKAVENFNLALIIAKKNGDISLQALLFNNLGEVFQKLDNMNSAYKNFKQAQLMCQNNGDKYELANSYIKLAEYFNENNFNDSTIFYSSKAIELSKEIERIVVIRDACNLLNEAYNKVEIYDSAYKYLKYYHQMNDSIINTGNTKKIIQLETKYEFEKEREIDEIKHKEEVKRQKSFTIFFVIAFSLVLILAIFILRNYRLKKKSEAKFKELNAIKDKFFRIISHDLKAPFTAFISISETLSNPNINLSKEKIQYFANSINKTAKSSFDLFRNLLLWSMSQRKNISVNKVEINFSKLVKNTVNLLKSSSDEKEIELKIEIQDDLVLVSDENIIKTVLRNLLNNAIKFTPFKGNVTVSSVKKVNSIEITVSDTGVGISEENLPKLFNPAVHHTTPGTKSEKGTGLGLILCKELLEKIEGKILVESVVNKGSKFIIEIPDL